MEVKALLIYFSPIYSLYRLFSIFDATKWFENQQKMQSQHFLPLFSGFSRQFTCQMLKITYTNYILSKSILKGLSLPWKIFTKLCDPRKCRHNQNAGNRHNFCQNRRLCQFTCSNFNKLYHFFQPQNELDSSK